MNDQTVAAFQFNSIRMPHECLETLEDANKKRERAKIKTKPKEK